MKVSIIQGRNTPDGVVIMHEAVHELKKLHVIVLKINFENTPQN
jgi:hypothetical protein